MVNHLSDNDAHVLDDVFGALSDRTRRAILARLVQGESTVTELAAPFQMSLAAVSKHIKVLEDAGLVTKTKAGRLLRCKANFARINDVNAVLEELSSYWNSRLEALDNFLTAEPNPGAEADVRLEAPDSSKARHQKNNPRKKGKGV